MAEMKNSEFVGMVAELLELNLKALDRTQKRVEEHTNVNALLTDRPPGEASAHGSDRASNVTPRHSCKLEKPQRRLPKSSQPHLFTSQRAEGREGRGRAARNDCTQTTNGWDSDTKIARVDAPLKKVLRKPSKAKQPKRSASKKLNTSLCADNGKLVAISTVDIGRTPAERNSFHLRVLDAIDIVLGIPPHPCIQAYHCTYRKGTKMQIYREHIPFPPLSNVKVHGLLKRPALKHVVTTVLECLQHLHGHGTAHGYIRRGSVYLEGENVLMSTPLIDWATRQDDQGGWVGKEGPWLPPEAFASQGIGMPSKEADIWGVGCLVMELLTGLRAWHHLAPTREAVRRILRASESAPLRLPPGVQGDAADFLKWCLCVTPEKRATVETLLQHRWLSNLDLNASHDSKGFLRSQNGIPGMFNTTKTYNTTHTSPMAEPLHAPVAYSRVSSSRNMLDDGLREVTSSPTLGASQSSALFQRVASIPAPLDRAAVESVSGSVHAPASVLHPAPSNFSHASHPVTPGSTFSSRVLPSPVKRAETAPSLKKGVSVASLKKGSAVTEAHQGILQELTEKTNNTESRMGHFEESIKTLLERQEATNHILSMMHAGSERQQSYPGQQHHPGFGAGRGDGGGGGGGHVHGHVHFSQSSTNLNQASAPPPHPFAAWGGGSGVFSDLRQSMEAPIVISR